MANKIDKLFALKAIEARVKEERELLEYECRDELVEAFEADGTDRRTSPYFGPEAGKFSIKRMKGKPAKKVTEYNLADDEAFADWLEDNIGSVISFVKVHAKEFAETYVVGTGEVPDGISVVNYEEPGTEPRTTAQLYSFKPELVIEKLAENGNFLDGANRLLLGGSDE